MKMRTIEYYVLVIVVLSGFSCNQTALQNSRKSKPSNSFMNFVEKIATFDTLKHQMKNDEYTEVIRRGKILSNDCHYKIPASYYTGLAYYQLNQQDSAIKWFQKAFEHGYDITILNYTKKRIEAIWDTLEYAYPFHHKKYLASIDTTLRHQLIEMISEDQSIRRNHLNDGSNLIYDVDQKNNQKLRGIINRFGWPGKKIVGENDQYFSGAGVLVVHSQEEDYFHFLPFMIASAEDNQDSWSDAHFAMQSLCWRFKDSMNRVWLRYIYLDNKTHTLDLEKSYLQLHALATLLHKVRFPWSPTQDLEEYKTIGEEHLYSVELFICAYPGEDQQKILNKYKTGVMQIKNVLEEHMRIPKGSLKVRNTVEVFSEKTKLKPRFGYFLAH